ncbi:hypothetical protein QAD02_005952 [Eretmocerus hayati]|uniref:Uncharacterized protein n=1 Tax=Eretmocerus hayati TaxID=131215 RepID=A0ACC2N3N2_9HYME|nr:hypothetical protein QAD02_005952 [Eretmocerus hayati]
MKLIIIFLGIPFLIGRVSPEGTTTPFPTSPESFSDLVKQQNQQSQNARIQATFICRICCAAFDSRRLLTTHIHRVHPGEGAYSCDFCSKSFSYTSNLANHLRSHTGERPFSCELCQTSYPRKESLKRHMLAHQSVKSFSCTICSASFTSQASLTKHMMFHSDHNPFSCGICNQRFRDLAGLQDHLKTHKHEIYSCQICKKKFSDSLSLECHVDTHGIKKPYICRLCSRHYKFMRGLEKHMIRHHQFSLRESQILQSEYRGTQEGPSSSFQDSQIHQEHECGDTSRNTIHQEIPDHAAGTSSDSCGACSCPTNSELIGGNYCVFEHLSDPQHTGKHYLNSASVVMI